MRYESFLARRYAFSKRRENFITIISILSIAGLTVGTAALVIVLSVFNGFSSVVTDIYVSFDPHLRVTRSIAGEADSGQTEHAGIPDAAAVAKRLRAVPGVRTVAPVVHGRAVLVHYTLPKVVDLTGMSASDAKIVTGLPAAMQAGSLQLDTEGIIIGQVLADEISGQIGDTLAVFSPNGLERILTEPITPRERRLIIRGIFAANNRDYDAQNVYTSPTVARDLFDLQDSAATSLDIKTDDIHRSNEYKATITSVLAGAKEQYTVASWYDLHTELYNVMEIERWVAYIILLLIVGVAAFNIFSSLTLTVYEKQRDIGLLRALGATDRGIRTIYFYQGMLVGGIGTLAGTIIGLLVVLVQQQHYVVHLFGETIQLYFPLDSSVYIIPALPVEIRWMDLVLVSFGSLGLTALCSLLPARRAAKVAPARALRWE